MIEVRWHGRGGQGAVTSVELLAQWRRLPQENTLRDSPVSVRKEEVRLLPLSPALMIKKSKSVRAFMNPDVVLVLDSSLIGLVNVTDGLKPDGKLIVNTA